MKKNSGKIKTNILDISGYIFIALGLIIFSIVYYPVIYQEVSYLRYKIPDNYSVLSEDPGGLNSTVIKPYDTEFGIVIPKINANAPIVADVDPIDPAVYQKALTRGVAHAKNTSLPDQDGSMFLFAHSTTDYFWASRYNAVFYLLNKLSQEDDVYIFYKGERYKYVVTAVKHVDAQEIDYLQDDSADRKLILMTCWPPGTTLRRLIIEAELVE